MSCQDSNIATEKTKAAWREAHLNAFYFCPVNIGLGLGFGVLQGLCSADESPKPRDKREETLRIPFGFKQTPQSLSLEPEASTLTRARRPKKSHNQQEYQKLKQMAGNGKDTCCC